MGTVASGAEPGRPAPFIARKDTRQAILIWCFLAPSLLIFLLYRILPLVWNVILSFEAWSPLKPAVFIGLENYEEMLTDDVFWQALWNTLYIVASAPLGIAMALGLALLVDSDIRGRNVYRTLIFLSYPLMTVASNHLALDVRRAGRPVQLCRPVARSC